mmetsp:Transcript_18146/g.26848  ORF Transcript_18146/g.26848 Transcript_18146/m.26848 type:complete len:99 (+) Transcript_18146:16-312(+)
MKFLALVTLIFFASVDGFLNIPYNTKTSLALKERINTSIDLDNPKVVTTETLSEGEKKVYCRCWKSGKFPLCDGAHVKHNQENSDNVGPLIVSVSKAE